MYYLESPLIGPFGPIHTSVDTNDHGALSLSQTEQLRQRTDIDTRALPHFGIYSRSRTHCDRVRTSIRECTIHSLHENSFANSYAMGHFRHSNNNRELRTTSLFFLRNVLRLRNSRTSANAWALIKKMALLEKNALL